MFISLSAYEPADDWQLAQPKKRTSSGAAKKRQPVTRRSAESFLRTFWGGPAT
jgi:hypothetical protein